MRLSLKFSSLNAHHDTSLSSWTALLSLLLLIPSISAGSPYRVWPRQSSNSSDSGGSRSGTSELRIRNSCSETIWPGIGTQAGKGPSSSGFKLEPGSGRTLTVSKDWQGRVWGRTNCSFNADGTRSGNGRPAACGTGDCNGVLNCVNTGATPVTLFEIALQAGTDGKQSFYDISLVDGYNLPMGITYLSSADEPMDLPPNLTNCACVASPGAPASGSGNSTFYTPIAKTSPDELSKWCPWDHQLNPPTKPGDGVYPYPDDDIKRPDFSPCLSTCAKTNSDEDCCTGVYNSPNKCKPNMFARSAKTVCPDAYSFAFDDQTSTFIVPSGGDWEISFCPSVPSTNIIKTFGKELADLGQGRYGQELMMQMQQVTLETVEVRGLAGHVRDQPRERVGSLGALVVMLAFCCLW